MKRFITMLLFGLFAALSSTGYAKANDLSQTDGIAFLIDVDDGNPVFFITLTVDTGTVDSFAYFNEGSRSYEYSVNTDSLERVGYRQNKTAQHNYEQGLNDHSKLRHRSPRDHLSDNKNRFTKMFKETDQYTNSIYRSPRDSLTKV